MPWLITGSKKERCRFVKEQHSGLWTMSELCERFGISRKTGYKWLGRFEELGLAGLEDRGRSPFTCPHKVSPVLEELICSLRRRHPTWGALKILGALRYQHPSLLLPAPSTVSDLLSRNGLVAPRRRRRRHRHPGVVSPVTHAPNDIWTADFKGHFRTRDGLYCYPLTIVDLHTRCLLECRGLLSTRTDGTRAVFDRVFREYGLPLAIRTDNGVPFASHGIHGLSQLNVWWMRLGIQHQRIRPSSPQQNGAHERMHRTLKKEACIPAKGTCRAQQTAFNRFRDEFNTVRPHAALGHRTPGSLYQPSSRTYSGKLPPQEYPSHFLVKRVCGNGSVRFHGKLIFLSDALVGHLIAMEEVAPGIWNVYLNDFLLGKIDERDYKLRT